MFLGTLTWDIDPVLIKLSAVEVRWYGLFFAGAILLGIFIMGRIFKAEKKDEKLLDPLLWYIVGGILIGARLGHCLFYEPHLYLKDPVKILKIWEGGLASHGGFIGILIALAIFCRRHQGIKFLWTLDRLMIPAAFGAGMIRLGNFFNSEIVGPITSKPWGVRFLQLDGPQAPARHATMLYESFTYFILGCLILAIYRKKSGNYVAGLLPGIFLTLAFTMRILLEFIKTDQGEADGLFFLNTGQMLSVPVVIAGLILWCYAIKKGQQSSH